MPLLRTVDPTELPVLLAELKAYMHVTTALDDGEIMGLARAVVDELDGPAGLLNRALCTQTLQDEWDGFPGRDGFRLSHPPLQSVSSIAYLDEDGATQVLATSVYRVLNAGAEHAPGRVILGYDQSWPATYPVPQAVTVTWIAGYGARNDVPERIRRLVLMAVREAYDWRDPVQPATLKSGPAWERLVALCRHAVVT